MIVEIGLTWVQVTNIIGCVRTWGGNRIPGHGLIVYWSLYRVTQQPFVLGQVLLQQVDPWHVMYTEIKFRKYLY